MVPQIITVPDNSVVIEAAKEKRMVVFPPAPTSEMTGVLLDSGSKSRKLCKGLLGFKSTRSLTKID